MLAFEGANHGTEIETIEEFLRKIKKNISTPHKIHLSGWVFQQVDFTTLDRVVFESMDVSGAEFWGCTFPQYSDAHDIRIRGASVVVQQPLGLPFKPYRAFMYPQEELREVDALAYKYFCERNDISSLMNQTLHDYFIQDALFDYIEGKTVVVIMGGHGMKRQDRQYWEVVLMAWKLVQNGFVVATGGGPGAMEAANLGAYMLGRSLEEVEEAWNIVSKPSGHTFEHQYLDLSPACNVLKRFGEPDFAGSLGIPTWKYGHEPSNMFATWHAKMFQNSVREDGLIAVGNGGIIYTPGSAGTRQEVFQTACRNHYADEGYEVPMVFYGVEFWKDSKVYETLKHNSSGRPFCAWLRSTDEVDEVVSLLVEHRASKGLPFVSTDDLKSPHWERGGSVHSIDEVEEEMSFEDILSIWKLAEEKSTESQMQRHGNLKERRKKFSHY